MLKDGKYVPVPVFVNEAGQAIVHTPTNAIVMLVQRDELELLTENHWSSNEMASMVFNGAIDVEKLVDPSRTLTRSGFTELAVQALGLGHMGVSDSISFLDMPSGAAAKRNIGIALQAGLFSGVSSDSFAPEREITREEIITVLIHVSRNFVLDFNPLDANKEPIPFNDADQTSEWAKEYITAAYEAGLVSGYPDLTIASQQSATLAESIALLRKLLQSTGLTN
jgi:hypothetical protein